jgi:hypothetical protein
VNSGRVLDSIVPSKVPGNSWRTAYVRAPREPACLVARTDRPAHWFAFSEPVAMSAVSYHAWRLCRQGQTLVAAAGFIALALAATAVYRRRRQVASLSRNSLSRHPGFSETRPLRMKFFTLTALLAAALFSVVVSVPFLPAAKTRSDHFALEVRASSTVGGALQVYYDDGGGLREALSARTTLAAAPEPVTYRLPFPPGTYKAFRLDPIDREGTVTIVSLRIVASPNRLIRELSLRDFKPEQQIESARIENGALRITTKPGSDDAQLSLALASPVALYPVWSDYARDAAPIVLPIFAALAALLFVVDRAPRLRSTLARQAETLASRPRRAVSVVAAVAVVASTYPVVFLGKSHVSPNLGTTLLYDTYPTLPGYQSAETVDVKGSDIGAVMWSHIPLSMV